MRTGSISSTGLAEAVKTVMNIEQVVPSLKCRSLPRFLDAHSNEHGLEMVQNRLEWVARGCLALLVDEGGRE